MEVGTWLKRMRHGTDGRAITLLFGRTASDEARAYATFSAPPLFLLTRCPPQPCVAAYDAIDVHMSYPYTTVHRVYSQW